MTKYKFSDNVIIRIVNILQEGMLLGVDVTDLMRQIEVQVGSDGSSLVLTEAYKQQVEDMHKKLLEEAEAHKAARASSKVVFNT